MDILEPKSNLNIDPTATLHQQLTDLFAQLDIDSRSRVTWDNFSKSLLQGAEREKRFDTYEDEPTVINYIRNPVQNLIFIKELRMLFACGKTNIEVWDSRKYSQVTTLFGHQAAILDIAYVHEGHHLFTSSMDRTIIMWDQPRMAKLRQVPTFSPQLCLTYDPHLECLLSGSTDGYVNVWSLSSSNVSIYDTFS